MFNSSPLTPVSHRIWRKGYLGNIVKIENKNLHMEFILLILWVKHNHEL